MKINSLLLAATMVAFFLTNCIKYTSHKEKKMDVIFPKGTLAPAENFTGKAWTKNLLPNDSTYSTIVGNVYFEPGARSNWHTHPAGQILMITDGIGYHQIKGQARETIKKGDIIKCPPNIQHWHGASQHVGMMQMYILPKTEKGLVKWLQKVSDQEYSGEIN